MSLAARALPIGVTVEVTSRHRPPPPLKIDIQRELDRIRACLTLIESRLEQAGQDHGGVLADDAVVDQRSVPAPRDLYLRLARQGAFASKKHGKRIVARWGDVRRALLDPVPTAVRTEDEHRASASAPSDGLDGLRQRLGLVGKGR